MASTAPQPAGVHGPDRPWVSHDRIFTINNVTWEQYETIRAALDDHSGLRMTYLEGTLELMSPGVPHESVKTTLARLVEAYADEMNIDLNGYGGATLRRKLKERGLEPDECYCIGEIKGETPELAIEVVFTSGTIEKLDMYEGLQVPEVWFWKGGQISIHWLTPNGYEPSERSKLLPDLDVVELARLISPSGSGSQTQAVRAYRQHLRDTAKKPAD